MTKRFLGLSCLVLALCGAAAAQGVVTTVAGTDLVLNLDGQPALTTPLGRATGVTLDNAGNPVFWAGGCTLVRIGPDGKLSVLAGNGVCNSYVEPPPPGPAVATAQFIFDTPAAFDAAGSLYVAVSCYVLKVTAGTISPFASLNCNSGITSLARDGAGNIYATDVGKQEVFRFNPDGTSAVVAGTGIAGLSGGGGPATSAMLNFPKGGRVRLGRQHVHIGRE